MQLDYDRERVGLIEMSRGGHIALHRLWSTDLKKRKRGGHAHQVVFRTRPVHGHHEAVIALAWQQLRLDVHKGLPREAPRVHASIVRGGLRHGGKLCFTRGWYSGTRVVANA